MHTSRYLSAKWLINEVSVHTHARAYARTRVLVVYVRSRVRAYARLYACTRVRTYAHITRVRAYYYAHMLIRAYRRTSVRAHARTNIRAYW